MTRPILILIALLGVPTLGAAAQTADSVQVAAPPDSIAPPDSSATPAPAAEPALRLRHPVDGALRRVSGDAQTVHTGASLPLFARVQDAAGEPVRGITVYFQQVAPVERPLGEAVTDRDGIATLIFAAGDRDGVAFVLASIAGGAPERQRIVYRIPVRKRSWALFMIFGLLGGLGLFLYGMNKMSASLQRRAGGRMRAVLGALTRNRLIGMAVGAFVTTVMQSSSATTVMMVSFVQARLMSFAQTLGVILGADIGTTVTAQLIAFRFTDYALPTIALGFGLRFLGKREGLRNWGDVILGFGMLFFGMAVMSTAMSPLRSYAPFIDLLHTLENPLLGILVGTLFTALIQSSGAFAGIVIVLAQQGFLTLEAGIPLILGANIGTCVTAGLASIGGSRDAKRVALAHTLFKVAGVALMVGWIPAFADLVRQFSSSGAGAMGDPSALARSVPRQVANAHTLFNVGIALLFLPLTGLAARFTRLLLPDRPEPPQRFEGRFLDANLLTTPALALNLARAEILRMGRRAKRMTDLAVQPFLERNLEALAEISELEHKVDALDAEITAYLIEIGRQDIGREQVEEVHLMMHVSSQYEHIADIIDKELRPLARKMIHTNVYFSETGAQEVKTYHKKASKQVSRSLAAFREGSLDKARRIRVKQVKYDAQESGYRTAHFERIRNAVSESVESSGIHLDLMDALHRINSYAVNIADAMLAVENNGDDDDESPPPAGPAADSA